MLKYQNILVYVDPTQEAQPALARAAKLIEKQQGGKITLFLTCYDLSYEMTSLSSAYEREAMQRIVIKEHTKWLLELAQPYKETGIEIQEKVTWHSRPFYAAILEVLEIKADILIKSTHQHSKLSAILFTPTDWSLLRKCPCPVLLVKAHNWKENGNILCAMDCNSLQENEDNLLSNQLIEEAKSLSAILSANVHLVNAYPSPPINIMLELPEFDPIQYGDNIKISHQEALLKHSKKYDIPAENTHLGQGIPEDVIADTAIKIDAELVVLGTRGKSGFASALLGHTAEQVIDNLNCDLLAIKPKDFKCPIEL